MKRPLVIVALMYGSGLLLGELLQLRLAFLFSASFVFLAAVWLLPRFRPLLLWPLLALTGWTNLVWHTAIVSPCDLRTLFSAPEIISARGRLCETPSERVSFFAGKESRRTLVEMNVSAVSRKSQWEPAFGRILVTTAGTLPKEFFSGQDVEISGVLAPPRPPLAEGLFDYRTYLRRHGIYFELEAASASDWHLLSTNRTPPLNDRFLAWAQKTLSRDLPAQDEPLNLLCAMTLGSKDALASDVYAPFIETGTMHIFAISGLHIALIAGILVSLLRVVRISRFWCGSIVVPLIWFYTGATGWQPSAIRSAVMMSIIVIGWSLKRPGDLLNSLAAAGLVILVWDPQQLFQASFQLSFFVVLSIALFLPPIEKLRDWIFQSDPLLPPKLIPQWKRRLGTPVRFLTNGLATSLAAWLGSWPLTVYYFHIFSPVTLLANMIIVPLSSAALAANMGSLICGAWFPWASGLFNHSAWLWMWLMTEASHVVLKLPEAFFYTSPLSFIDFVFYYSGLVAVLSGFALAPKRWPLMVAAAICLAGYYGWQWHESRQSTDLYVLPLNGGGAVYCDNPGSADDLLIDCGDPKSAELITLPFLHAHGLNSLPQLVLTHGDMRHVGGTDLLCMNLPAARVTTSAVRFRSMIYRRIVESLRTKPERHHVVNRGDKLNGWAVLHPEADDRFSQADDNSLVLRGEVQGTRVLLLADLGRPGQDALIERNQDLRADIVISGLPERGEPVCDALLEAVQPKLIIIVDSEYPATKRASKPLKDRLAQRAVPVIYTREVGGVKITLRSGRWEVVANGVKMTSNTPKIQQVVREEQNEITNAADPQD